MQRIPAQTFRDLIVWQKAHGFVLASYRLSTKFPRDEMYGLTSQFRRAAVSIAANIVEGFKKKGQHDKRDSWISRKGRLKSVATTLSWSQILIMVTRVNWTTSWKRSVGYWQLIQMP